MNQSNNYTIQIGFENVNTSKWDEFVWNHPRGMIFHTKDFLNIYRNSPLNEVITIFCVQNNAICGILTAIIHRQYPRGLLKYFTSRAVVMGGPLVQTKDKTDIYDLLIKSYKKAIYNKAIVSQFRNLWDVSDYEEIFRNNGYRKIPHLDILINLNRPFKEIAGEISKGKKGNVRKSMNKGTTITLVNDLEEFSRTLPLIKETYKRVKMPLVEDEIILNAFNSLKEKGLLKVFVAKCDGSILGTRLVLTYKNTIYDWYAGSDISAKNKYPNDIIPYHILKWGQEHHYHVFDFGGAGHPDKYYGVREHKIKFGGEIVNHGRYELVLNKIIYQIVKLAYNIYQKVR